MSFVYMIFMKPVQVTMIYIKAELFVNETNSYKPTIQS